MEEELYHYGVKGMKWGVRKERPRAMTKGARKKSIRDIRRASRNRSLLSDNELDARITRLRKEDELRRLTDQNYNQGRRAAAKALDRYGNQFATAAVEGVAKVVVKKVIVPAVENKINQIQERKGH